MKNKHISNIEDKPKNFSLAMKKIIKSLNKFMPAIILALIVSCVAAILAIIGPRKLSTLADLISEGLVINRENYVALNTSIGKDLKSNNANINIYDVDEATLVYLDTILTDDVIDNTKITKQDKLAFIKEMQGLTDSKDVNMLYKKLDNMPNNIKKIVEPTINIKEIKHISLILLILYLCSSLLNYMEGFIMAHVSNKYAYSLREKISKKINRLPLRYFDEHQIGDTLSRVTNDVDTLGSSMSQSFGELVAAITLLTGSIIMMFTTNATMAITAILFSILGFVMMIIILGKSQKYFIARQKHLGKLDGHIEEIYSSHNVVKAYNGEADASKRFDLLNDNVFESNRKSQFLSGLMPPIMHFIGNLSYVSVCVVGALLVMKGSITFGVIVAFMIYIKLFTSPLSTVAQGLSSLQSISAAGERVFEFLEEEELTSEKDIKDYLDPENVKGTIDFENVSFGYNPDKTIIKNFSCHVEKGQKIAIVGPTGAGKTTLVNLLMKFYEIKDGDIKIDGKSIKDLTRENIHDLFIMVLQDTWLFNAKLKDNIKYNNKNVSEDEIWKYLGVVGINHFVKTLPNGLDYEITEMDSISSGQKQLLTIARGMIKNAPFLILDEATSSVDTRTEEVVAKAMDKLMEKRTSFIIAHRLSTIKNADIILVLDNGNIVEQGNHKELMDKKGYYFELYNSQFTK